MSCDNWTYCTAIVDLVSCPDPTTELRGHATATETDLEGDQFLQQGRLGLIAGQSKSKGRQHDGQSRIIPDSTQIDPEYVWGDEGPIND
jgi:hypothetical protein